ncbi:hypothetical protein M2347_001844 [Chryseobacterium sp. H1D6B]|uniref:hypothetical protein n=1 Tax=Chryseobacterium sp. H1D6B TaxID=2940588 RepID=UPI0015CD957F|nr:hypothetical protein [Chryseobacterium sp. H1D6B]MDH6252117.1 hypothetical protein [Chryseobacterium sp. H1D6B]
MKKFLPLLLLAFVSLFIFSCDKNDDNNFVDHDTYSVAYDITPTFSKVNSNLYEYNAAFNTQLGTSDVLLVYMQTGLTNNNAQIWKLLPYTFFVNNANNDQVDYSFDFSKFDFAINVNSTSTLNLDTNSTYYANKRFRVVIVPASTGKNAGVDFSDYNSVAKYYNIDESKIKTKN